MESGNDPITELEKGENAGVKEWMTCSGTDSA
jgi:hypothetical protein